MKGIMYYILAPLIKPGLGIKQYLHFKLQIHNYAFTLYELALITYIHTVGST